MSGKKGQSASNTGALVIIIGLLIILYILFLPPSERAELLGEDNESDDDNNNDLDINTTLLSEHIGRLDYLRYDNKIHDIPSFRIITQTEGIILKSINSLYVKSGSFEKISKNLTFEINKDLTKNTLLSFNLNEARGRLIITLNGHEIFSADLNTGTAKPISLSQEYLESKNLLSFKVSNTGIAFWKINEYSMENLLITADVTDLSQSESLQFFYLSDVEVLNMDDSTLRFYADCDLDTVGPLIIKLNGVRTFSSTADCGIYNSLILDKNLLLEGKNQLGFLTSKGSYLIDRVSVSTQLKELNYPVYYFDMDEDLFDEDGEKLKEDYNIMLRLSFVDNEEKRAEIKINGIRTNLRTDELEYEREIDWYVLSGSNSIEIIPQTLLEIREMLIEVEEED
ncbi:MAG: hypothetical protein ABIC91_02910 [Nanoarchaeota archaeon]|nr:hypothetical protein [Nanoarchaeota archaeon]MBU1030540.1 hypothetical protein [Nanoarchaeota archaeon]MBU1850760.1 hypothetical protein [Nanoarchaeota archaeon]